MLHNLDRRGGLRRAGAIVAGLLLVASTAVTAMAASDSDGRMSVTPNTATAGGTASTVTFSFYNDNTNAFNTGSLLELTIPAGWTPPTTAAGAGSIAVAEGAYSGTNTCNPSSIATRSDCCRPGHHYPDDMRS